MPRSAADIAKLLGEYRQEMRTEFARASLLNKRIEGKLTSTWMPKNADAEYRDLFRKASGPWLEFTASSIAQGIRVDGCNSDPVWSVWQANGMDGRQNGVTLETVRLGKSYLLVLPAVRTETILDPETEEPTGETREVPDTGPDTKPILRPVSSLTTFAHYADPWDDFPEWALIRIGPVKSIVAGDAFWNSRWMFLDDEALYRYSGDGINPQNLSTFEHGMVDEDGYQVTPLARVANTLPAFGEPQSSVERAIPVYQRIVDATFTLEMVQRYGAFPQKWMSGGTVADGTNVSADSLLSSSDFETKFGNFTQANLTDVVNAVDAHIKHLAAVTQVPPHYLLGAVVNMSAEGIAAAESGYFRNINERQDSISEGFELGLRLVGRLLGLTEEEIDDIQLHFEDVSSRSLSQIADAIQKLDATLPGNLGRLISLLPGFTQLDAITAEKNAKKAKKAVADALPPASAKLAISAPAADYQDSSGVPPAPPAAPTVVPAAS